MTKIIYELKNIPPPETILRNIPKNQNLFFKVIKKIEFIHLNGNIKNINKLQ